MQVDVYTNNGKKQGSAQVADAVFSAPSNNDLLHQVVVSMQANARTNVAHTKDRSEVRGGGKKPWKQKGTGRARHGSRRSPIWVGGGVTFGPRNERDFSKKINKKMRTKALYAALSEKIRDGSVLFVDTLALEAPKTAAAKTILESLAGVKGYETLESKHNAAIIYLTEKDENTAKSFRNFGNVSVKLVRNANPLDVLNHKNVIIVDPEAASAILEARAQTNVEEK